ncbi:MAG: hypothetical protein COV91_05055 [Candidatus Taylorbacteria bacterium CG11_big_fil_rev_8_21_14_0_20_46_11]|uniref:Uncharacterized protein n=1 Tax=Candidatus Taylorbacteria bacterium CG11_big_fil_rev_8_21_14_0_20_46_11 TaxID=1975025 RepID=A0A2H0KAI4_9BACT|nr:MAG: hypothetical protein COV91_05055 [Candidatus Taylorbacteria bacterium CG11_big_fil_rev_8_21_14_0_20_46_11]
MPDEASTPPADVQAPPSEPTPPPEPVSEAPAEPTPPDSAPLSPKASDGRGTTGKQEAVPAPEPESLSPETNPSDLGVKVSGTFNLKRTLC